MTTVAVVGPGRVGTLLAVACARAGLRVVTVSGGRAGAREAVTGLVAGVRALEEPAAAVSGAELVLLAVPDDVIEPVVTELAVADAFHAGQRVVHLAGSRGLAPLARAARCGARVAACHPAMTVPTGARDPALLVGVAWAVTAPPPDRGWAHELVSRLGGDPHDVPEAARTVYHAALAVASNAVGAAVVTARRLLLAAGVDAPEAFLVPLVRASADNAAARGAAALTGPVVRGDTGTIAAHLDALEADLPELAEAYRWLMLATLAPVRPGLEPAVAAELERLLTGGG